jgi:ubiquinone/menaquinone biosynthesis C-methylase UbiE
MRVVDLDRDMSDVFPTGTSIDSEHLFRRMEEVTREALEAGPGARVVDVASGVGQDTRGLARLGAWVAGVEPSARMTALARLSDDADPDPLRGGVVRVRAWSEALPFDSDSFDSAFCKGSLDHFDDPERCIREMARVTRAGGRVVLAVANFDSLAVSISRALERLRRAPGRGRRHHDVPSDHFTRYDRALLHEQMGRFVAVDRTTGVSLLWGVPGWARLLHALGPRLAMPLLRVGDRLARLFPSLADVIVVSGVRRSALSLRDPVRDPT